MRLIKASKVQKEIQRANRRKARQQKKEVEQFVQSFVRHINYKIRKEGICEGTYYANYCCAEEKLQYTVEFLRARGYSCKYELREGCLREYVISWSVEEVKDESDVTLK